MPSLCGSAKAIKKKVVRVDDALRYAMTLPVATTISGIDSMRVLHHNVKIATNFKPFTQPQMERLRHRFAGVAADGRFELYKTSAEHEGDEGRAQHEFPSQQEMGG